MNDRALSALDTASRTASPLRAVFASSTLFLLLCILIGAPTTIYADNQTDFYFGFATILAISVTLFVSLGALCVLLCRLTSGRALIILSVVSASLALLCWIYSSFLSSSLQLIDGTHGALTGEGAWLDLVLIATSLLISTVLVLKWPRTVLVLFAALSIGELSKTAYTLASLNLRWKPLSEVDTNGLFSLSDKKNLVIVLLDTLQSDIFDEIIEQDEALRRGLSGFIYYPNTLSVAPTTYLSMPAIHAGIFFDGEASLKRAYEEGIKQGSFLNRLSDEGYDVMLVNPVVECPARIRACVPRTAAARSTLDASLSEATYLYDTAIFRSIPSFLRDAYFNDGNFLISPMLGGRGQLAESNLILDRMATDMAVSGSAPTVKFMHLMSTHPPLVFSANCEMEQAALRSTNMGTRKRMVAQSTCALRKFLHFLDALRKYGVYDNTAVVLMADHGYNQAIGNRFVPNSTAVNQYWLQIMGASNPLLAIKPRRAGGELKVSNAALSVLDIGWIAMRMLNEPGTETTVESEIAKYAETRAVRSTNFYRWQHEYWLLDHVPGVQRLEVAGNLWDINAWSGRFYPLGEELDFRVNGNGDKYLFGDWSEPEPRNRWTDGREASVLLDLGGDVRDDLVVTAQLSAFVTGKWPRQEIDVLVNDVELDKWVFTAAGDEEKEIAVPLRLIAKDGVLKIVFRVLNPASPASLGMSADWRTLGISLKRMKVTQVPAHS